LSVGDAVAFKNKIKIVLRIFPGFAAIAIGILGDAQCAGSGVAAWESVTIQLGSRVRG
jgi:hypothetical protein